jgi:hypothetical protein
MNNLSDIKYDWITSIYYKKDMNKWAINYLKNNEVNFDLIKYELNKLIIEDNTIGLKNFNRYGIFDMALSSLPNALVSALIVSSKNN